MRAIVLNIDDCSDDLVLNEYACACAGVSFELRSLDSGEKAIAYLNGSHTYSDREKFPFPSLILLDLKMPAMSGFEVLEWIRKHEHLKHVPVIVFTGSVHAEDRRRAMELGANQFWVKPPNFEKLQQMMAAIDRQLSHGIGTELCHGTDDTGEARCAGSE